MTRGEFIITIVFSLLVGTIWAGISIFLYSFSNLILSENPAIASFSHPLYIFFSLPSVLSGPLYVFFPLPIFIGTIIVLFPSFFVMKRMSGIQLKGNAPLIILCLFAVLVIVVWLLKYKNVF